ncbi:RNA polymerase sigma factor [Streptomyces anulatus]
MTRTAARLLRDASVPTSVVEADDILSSAFAKALRNPGEVRQPVPYVYALIRTEVQHLVTRRNEHICRDQKRAADPVASPAPYVADFTTFVDNRDAVHRAVSLLTAPQQSAVWATHGLGYTREETAVLMGKHPGTVARHATRGMATLRACFVAVFAAIVSTVGRPAPGRGPRRPSPDRPCSAVRSVVGAPLDDGSRCREHHGLRFRRLPRPGSTDEGTTAPGRRSAAQRSGAVSELPPALRHWRRSPGATERSPRSGTPHDRGGPRSCRLSLSALRPRAGFGPPP